LAIDVHGARTALAQATTVFGAFEQQLVLQHMQQGGFRIGLHFVRLAIDLNGGHERSWG
jgi:hypothetical protein